MSAPDSLLLIFVKHPVPGEVKTRLGASIGYDHATKVYEELLAYTRTQTEKVAADKAVFYGNEYPDEDLWSAVNYSRHPQKGPDLGERMANAFAWAFVFGAYKRVVIIGSDCAELTHELLNEAFEKLKQYDAVIGPAKDGGYYLLGLKEVFAPVFMDKEWSTETVLAATLRDLEGAGKSIYQLPVLADIDTVEDLSGTFLAHLGNH